VGIDSRGFIIGGALAHLLGKGFVPVRKKGKLPAATESETYDLEYGTDTIEIHCDAILPGQKVLIIDDFLASGATILGLVRLAEAAGAKVVGIGTLIEKAFEGGRDALKYLNLPVESLARIASMDGGKITFQ